MSLLIDNQETRANFCISPENMKRLQEIMIDQKVTKDSPLFWEHDAADKVYYIKKGKIKVTKNSNDGKVFILYVFREGDFVGQLDPYSDSTQQFNGIAIEDSVVGVIHKQDLETLLWQYSDLAIDFMKWMGLVSRITQTKFRDLIMYGKQGALCSTLIRLANSYGVETPEGILIKQKLTNTDLADYIGAARESVSRMLSALKKENAVDMKDGYLLLKDIDYLKDICHCETCPKEICRI
ncbi:anaerobic regulatory protein [Insulibacter thermoxylanivorax]|uniref:Anaerobic regulatory protein n=1 Tax=Insulibacter thermoxylanivorax TaxID=2749268 RepID=A0A916QC36_9BACL|nr:Crp/Fnr family transcriptional regulator [Insulibacter thermoxylanivorax]GFR38006.1 anaerobic regulatory protein [Insulibacter thermoxylanivorax]